MVIERVLGAPHPAVRELVATRYSGSVLGHSGPVVVPAEPSVSLIFNLTGGAFVTGVGGPYRSSAEPRTWAAMTLTPLGAYRVGVPVSGQVVSLGDLLGSAGRELAEAMSETPGWQRRFELMDRFLANRAEHRRPAPEVAWVWRRLVSTRGGVPIRRLAAEVGWSHQHLIRKCREQLGQPPKTVARMLRFKAAVGRIRREGRWEPAVFDAGYYDQAHFCRDLREFTATTLTTYLANALPCGCVGEFRPRSAPASAIASGA